jgi:hypothetical protein
MGLGLWMEGFGEDGGVVFVPSWEIKQSLERGDVLFMEGSNWSRGALELFS